MGDACATGWFGPKAQRASVIMLDARAPDAAQGTQWPRPLRCRRNFPRVLGDSARHLSTRIERATIVRVARWSLSLNDPPRCLEPSFRVGTRRIHLPRTRKPGILRGCIARSAACSENLLLVKVCPSRASALRLLSPEVHLRLPSTEQCSPREHNLRSIFSLHLQRSITILPDTINRPLPL